jgi:tRNA(Ile)-lysidine synthase
MIRKSDADLDQKFVENLCQNLNITCVSESIDVMNFAQENKMNMENAARQLRYEFYYRVADKVGAKRIALGHTADDTVETLLMRLLRGAGLKGLIGIPPVRDKIIRPLIKIWRRDIDKYIASLKLVPRSDHTNYESKYLRNRVRLKLIPQLKIYNLNIKGILLQTVLLLTEDYLYLENKVKQSLDEIVLSADENTVNIDVEKLRTLDQPVQGHLIRGAIEKVKGNLLELTFYHIREIIKNLNLTKPWELHLPDKIFVYGRKDSLSITKEKVIIPKFASFHYELKCPGEVTAKEAGLRIKADIIENMPANEDTKSNMTAYIDYDEVGKFLIVRNRKPGDRFSPLGMRGSKKLQDFFVDEKILLKDRDVIPIVESDGQIVWIVGHRIDERMKVRKNTRKILKLTAEEI